jgi:hypothetical protein
MERVGSGMSLNVSSTYLLRCGLFLCRLLIGSRSFLLLTLGGSGLGFALRRGLLLGLLYCWLILGRFLSLLTMGFLRMAVLISVSVSMAWVSCRSRLPEIGGGGDGDCYGAD